MTLLCEIVEVIIIIILETYLLRKVRLRNLH